MKFLPVFVLACLGVAGLLVGCAPQPAEDVVVEETVVQTDPAPEESGETGMSETQIGVIKGQVLLADFKPFLKSLSELDGHGSWSEDMIDNGYKAVQELGIGDKIDGGLHLDIGDRHIDVTLQIEKLDENTVLMVFGEVPPNAEPELQSRLDKYAANR
ncbi:MAG: hypothetical protein ACK4P3_08520 [Fimbriimonadaceae bacterium]